jgi:Tannase-like family of unknown function (DUF6351)
VSAAPDDAGRLERFTVEVVSSAPDQVSGGDALVEVGVPAAVAAADVRIELNGADVTGRFAPQAGEPVVVEGGIWKCRTEPVRRAIRDGVHGSWHPTRDQRRRLEAIFPDGVCDYSRRDAGAPR